MTTNEKGIYEHDFSRHAILFRERLVELRKEKGYTQQALADLLGISVWTLNSYEAKGVLPRFDMIIMLLYQNVNKINTLYKKCQILRANAPVRPFL